MQIFIWFQEQQAKLSEKYYPNTPMLHYLVKMLKLHGLYFDEHLVWREVQVKCDGQKEVYFLMQKNYFQNEIRISKGKIIYPLIGAGKQKMKAKI